MAESMVLRIVLEGVDNASDDIERTTGKAKELKNTLDDTTMAGVGLLLAVNGLASGLNQVSGGMRKFADSGERAGYVSEQSAEKIRGWSDTLEFAAGPLEILAGVANFFAAIVIIGKFLPALGLAAKAMSVLGIAAAVVTAPITGTVIVIGALIAALVLFGLTIYLHREKLKELSHEYVNIGGRIEWIARKFDDARDAAEGFSDAVKGAFDIPGNIRNQINSELRGGI